MTPSVALQAAIISLLSSDPALSEITSGEISQNVPEGFKPPYISLGPSSFVPQSPDGLRIREETLQVDCWTDCGGNLSDVKMMADHVSRVLDGASLDLSDPFAASEVQVVLVRCFPGEGMRYEHGVIQVAATVEDLSIV